MCGVAFGDRTAMTMGPGHRDEPWPAPWILLSLPHERPAWTGHLLDRPAGDVDAERERLRQTVTRLQAELTRLTEALGSGGHLPSIVAAITEREGQRSRTEQELAALGQVEQARGFDLPRVEQDLRAKLADWRGLLARNVGQARQALRSLVPERLTFTPKNERGERFYGRT
jgi:hypothetical protein